MPLSTLSARWQRSAQSSRTVGGWVRRIGALVVTASSPWGCDASVNIGLLPLESTPSSADESSTTTHNAELDAAVSTPSRGMDAAIATSNVAPPASAEPTQSVESAQFTTSSAPTNTIAPDAGVVTIEAPLHHYDFVGDGTVVPDIVGFADGAVVGGAVLDASGALELDGLDDFVDLPNGLLSSLSAATVTLWVEWRGGVCWQRLFDFGSSSASEDTASSAETSLFVTPASCRASHLGPVEHNVTSLMFHTPAGYSVRQDDTPMPVDTRVFVALSADNDGALQLSLDGETVIELTSDLRLSDLDDVNNWIGRSQWGQDPTLRAALYDLRIYGVALTSDQIRALFERTAAEQ